MRKHVAIIGAGPAGLTAGYLLSKQGVAVTVIETDPENVGGIARTVKYKGYCFDIGGHRFFSKSKEIEALWTELLPHDMLERPRSSRIFYRQRFFAYPLKAFDALRKLGVIESWRCVISYLKARIQPIRPVKSFADWVINHFGERLYSIFFKTYTEKVWGMRCESISADWAAQRIKGLSLSSAIKNALLPQKRTEADRSNTIKTLIDTFRYPRKGPGMLWEACAAKIREQGGEVLLGSSVYGCQYLSQPAQWQVYYRDQAGLSHMVQATDVISSAPLRELALEYLNEGLSNHAIQAANALQYRDFLIVVLILKEKNLFSDNWIYVHDASVDVARIQNFKSWSPEMVPDQTTCSYGMEYFCFEGDGLWAMTDEQLLQKASEEIVYLGLAEMEDILDGCVVRQHKAYPVYDQDYQQHVDIIARELKQRFPSLHLVGRNGMHKYNNQDHAMMTAMLTVKNILAEKPLYDVWQVNQDADYHEAGAAGTETLGAGLRMVPEEISQ